MKIKIYYFLRSFMSESTVEASTSDMRGIDCLMTNRIFLEETEIEIPDVPVPGKAEICASMVRNLEKQKSDLQAATHLQLVVINEKINQLLCLEVQS